MRYVVMVVMFLQFWVGPAWATTDKGFPSTVENQNAKEKDFHQPFVGSGCDWAVPSSSLILAAITCEAYVKNGAFLALANQNIATSITLPAVDGLHWVAMRVDRFVTPAGYTEIFGAHFVHQQSATQPADLDGVLVVSQFVVAGGIITGTTRLAS